MGVGGAPGPRALVFAAGASWLHALTRGRRQSSRASRQPYDAEAVVRVAQFRRDARAVGHGAPGDLVAPGTAAGDPAGSGQRAVRIQGWRGEVIPFLVPVHAPLVAGAREVGEAVAVGRSPADVGWPGQGELDVGEDRLGLVVAPR